MKDRPDLYVILGVDPSATPEEIKTAYRERVAVLHPDRFDRERNPAAWEAANRMLADLNRAYRVLSDPILRQRYDATFARVSSYTQPDPEPPHESRQPAPASPKNDTPSSRPTSLKYFFWPIAAFVVVMIYLMITEPRARSRNDKFFLSGPPSELVPIPEQTGQEKPLTPRLANSPPVSPQEPVWVDRLQQLLDSLSKAAEHRSRSGNSNVEEMKPVGCEPGITSSSLPANGTVWRYDTRDPLAPLEVRVRGEDQYLVKIDRGNSTVAMMLIRAGRTAEMLVPVGQYRVKYATGSGDYWCGIDTRFPFGRETAFHKAEGAFPFVDEGTHYTGYTLELFLQENGNLQTESIMPTEW